MQINTKSENSDTSGQADPPSKADIISDKDILHLVKKIIKNKPSYIVIKFIEINILILSELNLNTIVSFDCKNMYSFDLTEIGDNEAFTFNDFDKTNHLDTFITNRFKSLINISGQEMYDLYKNFCYIYYPEFKTPSNRMFLKAMKIYTGDSKKNWLKPNIHISLTKLASEIQLHQGVSLHQR